MNNYADKSSLSNGRALEVKKSQSNSQELQPSNKFVDNRPEMTAQRKLYDIVTDNQQSNRQGLIQPVQKKVNNTGLPDNLKLGIENISGYAMDDVKVHYNSNKPAQLNAHAYAKGTEIHLANGQEKHLPHEAWHVVQQKQGRVTPNKQILNSEHINDDMQLEREADYLGAKAAQFKNIEQSSKCLKQTNLGTQQPVQRKVGVEFESEWKVYENMTTPIGKKLHKKKLYGTDEFRVENDGGELEFVSYPPSSDGPKLIDTVQNMQSFANKMISNNKKSERFDNAILVKADPLDYIESHKSEEKTPQEMVAAIYADHYNDDANLEDFIKAMRATGWTDEGGITVKDGPWDVAFYEPVFGIELPKTKNLLLLPNNSNYQNIHSAKHIFGAVESDFEGHYIHVNDVEKEMRTKPQFSFGVPMEMIPKLFEGFKKGLGDADQQQQVHYESDETTTLNEFSKKVGESLKLSDTYPAAKSGAEIMKGKTGGFITYLNFYLDKMRKGMREFNNSYLATQIKSVHLAQTIIKHAQPNSDNGEIYDLDDTKINAIISELLLTDDDKKLINVKVDPKTFNEIISEKKISKKLYLALQAFYDEAIDKTKKDLFYPKYYFTLMNRSGFDTMFDSLNPEEQNAVNKYVTESLIPKLIELKAHNMLFSVPYFYKTKENNVIKEYGISYGPKLLDWWKSVAGTGRKSLNTGKPGETTNRDLMSPPTEFVDIATNIPDPDQSLGALGFVDEGKVVMELRNWGEFVPASEWVKHTSDMAFALAKLLT